MSRGGWQDGGDAYDAHDKYVPRGQGRCPPLKDAEGKEVFDGSLGLAFNCSDSD